MKENTINGRVGEGDVSSAMQHVLLMLPLKTQLTEWKKEYVHIKMQEVTSESLLSRLNREQQNIQIYYRPQF